WWGVVASWRWSQSRLHRGIHQNFHRAVTLRELHRFGRALERHPVRDDLGEREAVEVPGEEVHRRDIGGCRLTSDADDADVLGADIGVGIDADRPHVHERARLHDGATVAHEVKTLRKRL